MSPTQEPLVLILDIGSSSVRGLLFDRRGQEIKGSEARQPVDLALGSPQAPEPDPDTILDRIWSCLDGVLAQAGKSARRIVGVGVCTFVSNVLGLDKNGRPLTGLLSYADTRSAPQADNLKLLTDERQVLQRTGCRFHPSYLTAQLSYLAETRPDVFRAADRWVSLGEYLELKLFGRTRVSHSVASWTGLLDRNRLVWDKNLLSLLNLTPERLSPLTGLNRPRQGLKPEFARRWPDLDRAAWFPAVGDGAAANMGSGCLGPDRVALTMGTSTAMRVVLSDPPEKIPEGLFCYRVDENRVLLGGALTEGGGLYRWFKDILALEDEAVTQRRLLEMKPDSHGLTVLPFWSGERSPGWAGWAKGAIDGLSLTTGPLDLLRAAMEAVAYRIVALHRLLADHLSLDHAIVVSGAALRNSPAWRGIVADALGRRIIVPQADEASARGTALLVLEALGIIDDLSRVDTPAEYTLEPDPKNHLIHKRARQRQQDFYRRTLGV